MSSENDKITKLLEAKSKETRQMLDQINKSIKDFNKSYLSSFKYPDELVAKLDKIAELVRCTDKTPEQIILEIKTIVC